jgi:cysteine desulfurase/selenocysteine lyase
MGPAEHRDALAEQVRPDFPILSRRVHGRPLVYLDSAATSQKPRAVIEALVRFYEESNANVHRSPHRLAEEATAAYEEARDKVAGFINAPQREGVIFTSGTTQSINLVASAWGQAYLKPGDEIVVTEMEHHSNLVPWQLVTEAMGARLRFLRVGENGTLSLDELERLLNKRTQLVGFTAVSNVLGTVNPTREIVERAHAVGALTLVDGALSVPHMPTDVQRLGCDFLAFSGHKMLGPNGIGVLYGKPEILETMPPYVTGGGMIGKVTRERSTWAGLPYKFEAGTPSVANAVALGAAIDYLRALGMERVWAHTRALTAYAVERLREIAGVTVYGDAGERGVVVSFNVDGAQPHDLATHLDQRGIAIRAGHHCAQPLMQRLGVAGAARASVYVYNTRGEVDALAEAVAEARAFFRRSGGMAR